MALLLLAPVAQAAPKFPALTGRVVDQARVLSPQVEAKLAGESEQLEQETGRQFVVATVPDLQGYEIEDYGYQLLRTWGIGRKAQDDGVILLVAPSERRVRIEVGYGLEPVLTDALSSVILQERVLPRFREGQTEAGIVSGAEAVIQQLRLPEGEAKAKVAQAAQAAQAQAEPEGGGLASIIVLLLIFWVLSALLRGRRGGGAWWILPLLLGGGGRGGGHGGGGFGGGGFGGGGFSGGGGSGGGGGATGRW